MISFFQSALDTKRAYIVSNNVCTSNTQDKKTAQIVGEGETQRTHT